MLHLFLFNLMIISRAAGWTDDYWSNDFDPDKDCAQEEKIAKLKNQVKLPSSRGWTHFILEMLLYLFLKIVRRCSLTWIKAKIIYLNVKESR